MKESSRFNINSPLARAVGLTLLFMVIGWAFYIHLPSLSPGYLNGGDDHIHVAFANELVRIWADEGKLLGWSKMYATGSPIFLLRPPGFYVTTAITHILTGISVEDALKFVVVFGFSLFPLTIYICGRLLGIGFWGSVFSGLLSVLPISLWGHTIDSYQYLGVHKQLLAILVFPLTVGSLWRLLKEGRYGLLYAVSFAFIFMTHPYIAYSFAILSPGMVIALACNEPQWQWKRGIKGAFLWSIPSFLFICIWLIPFVFSNEIQLIDPFLSRKKAFDVIVSTTAETFRQFFLGGIFDTTRYAGPFGGTGWVTGNEWGWRRNDSHFRVPVITIFCFLGWLVTFIRPKAAYQSFLGLAFLTSLLLFIGPDDFPILNAIPFAKQFQNVHAIFMLEWVAIMLGGLALQWLYQNLSRLPGRVWRYGMYLLVTILIGAGFYTSFYERTIAGEKLIDVRNIYTKNGELVIRPDMHPLWKYFANIVDILQKEEKQGNISGMPKVHDETVLYNLLPHMVDRPVYISGFSKVGGVYVLLLRKFRSSLRNNYEIQKLFNIRYVINSPHYRGKPIKWHNETEYLYEDKYFELMKIKGDFGDLAALPGQFVGFVGSEREWAQLMTEWMRQLSRGKETPWVINLNNSGMGNHELQQLIPYLKMFVLGKNAAVPEMFAELPKMELEEPVRKFFRDFQEKAGSIFAESEGDGLLYETPPFKKILDSRKEERFSIVVNNEFRPVLFKRAFYRGWEARLNGREIPIFRVSPGLQMVLLPKGVHELSYLYTGPVHWPWAKAAFVLGIIFSGILTWQQYRLRKGGREEYNSQGEWPIKGKYLSYLPSSIWLVFLVLFSYKAIMETAFKIPVTNLPGSGQMVTGSTVDFYWNNVMGIPYTKQKFLIQVSTDKQFSNIVETQNVSKAHARFRDAFEEGRSYYYRIRLETDGKEYGWTRPIKFYRPDMEKENR